MNMLCFVNRLLKIHIDVPCFVTGRVQTVMEAFQLSFSMH